MKQATIGNKLLWGDFLSKKLLNYMNVCIANVLLIIPLAVYIALGLFFGNIEKRIFQLSLFLPRPQFIYTVSERLTVIKQSFIGINTRFTFLNKNITEITALYNQEQIAKNILRKSVKLAS